MLFRSPLHCRLAAPESHDDTSALRAMLSTQDRFVSAATNTLFRHTRVSSTDVVVWVVVEVVVVVGVVEAVVVSVVVNVVVVVSVVVGVEVGVVREHDENVPP